MYDEFTVLRLGLEYTDYIFIWLCGTLVKTLTEGPVTLRNFILNLVTSAFVIFILIKFLINTRSKEEIIVITAFFVLVCNNAVYLILALGRDLQQNPGILVKWLVQFFKR